MKGRSSGLVRQWQVKNWLEQSRRPLTVREIRDALALDCSLKTVRRDLQALREVFDIDTRRTRGGEEKFSDATGYLFKGPRGDVPKFGPQKKCAACGALKGRRDDFNRDWKEPDEKSPRCRDCEHGKSVSRRGYFREYYRANKKRVLGGRRRRREEEGR